VFAALTAPGQTAGLAPFTDVLIADLDISRTAISASYLVATLAGAAMMPFVGRMLDRHGAKIGIVWIVIALSLVLVAASFVGEIFGLTAAYVGLRMTGQGALMLAATTLVARLVTHRSGLALGIAGAIGAGGVSLAPVFIERLIAATDIATAWRVEALVVLAIGVPLVLLLPRDRPITHTDTGTLIVVTPQSGYDTRDAVATLMFWVFTGGGFAVGMMSTGLAFHLISLLGEQGLTSFEAASNFIPQTIAALLATLALGAVVDRIDPRWGVVVSMLCLASVMLMLPWVTPGTIAVIFGLLLGASQGAMRGVEAAALVTYFGRAHIGSIRGVATSVMLGATALGPLYFAIGREITGTYIEASMWGALLPLAIVALAACAKPPEPFPTADQTA
jgi:MFS family permease